MVRFNEIRKRLSELSRQTTKLVSARKERKKLYEQLDELQFKSDYLMVVMSKPSDFDKLNKGFSVNGIEYRRLVGTTGGVKQSTIVYCSVINERGIHIYEELEKRLNGGRDETKELIPAKFEAYKALACSASVPVSMPKGVLVVDDFVLNVNADYIQLEDSETSDEPVETYVTSGVVELNASDGFGLMCPELAERWSAELGLDYVAGGMCIRNLFCKGMAYTFDFREFARRYYDGSTISDVWGTVHKIEDIELIVPVSVMKLWDSYNSIGHYLECCEKYHHGFAVTKTCEKELENERTLNYQFIQSYELTDDEIRELVMPTVTDIQETIHGNVDKTILFLHGDFPENYHFAKDDHHLVKALMIEPELAGDPYIISVVNRMLEKKKEQTKIGKVKVHGNYSVISGDPFAFCQKIFGCNVPDSEKGLLRAGEMYSKYWVDDSKGEGKRVVCFRAPMSCHNNIRAMDVVHNDEIDYWYQYMPTVNIINVHDMFYPALSGADNDGDAILVTDNEILLKKWRDEPAILCVQKKGQKSVITLENLTNSNKNGFGNAIGAITNRVTAMYDIMSNFSPDSEQHKVLEYRIRCGQQYQQAEIDKIKGIVSKPMPSYWYTWSKVKLDETDTDEMALFKEENREIVANKKPYFMKYIYRDLGKRTNDYIKNADMKSLINTNLPLKKILSKIDLTENESAFVEDYRNKLPVTDNGSVMNRLSHISEELLKRIGTQKEDKSTDFVKMLSSGSGKTANSTQMQKLRELYKQYRDGVQTITMRCNKDEKNDLLSILQDDFQRQALDIYSNMQTLCDSLLKICYKSQYSKRFVWKICGEQIVDNLINKYGNYIYYVRVDEGDVEFRGRNYKKITRSAFEDLGDGNEDFEIEIEDEEEDYEYDYDGDE